MKRNVTIVLLSLIVITLAILYIKERTWHDVVQNGMTLGCYLDLQRAINVLEYSSEPLGIDERTAEDTVNKVIDDFFLKSVLGNAPESIRITVHDALSKLALAETDAFCERSKRATGARQEIEEAIETTLRK